MEGIVNLIVNNGIAVVVCAYFFYIIKMYQETRLRGLYDAEKLNLNYLTGQ